MKFNKGRFEARVYHGLKSLLSVGDTLPPRFLEIVVCDSFGFEHVGDSTFYADGYRDKTQVSIKTRMLTPHILKTKAGRDFQTNPALFLGPQQNVKQNKWTAGLEIVQRRQQLDFENDSTEYPEKVGKATLKGFEDNILESHRKFGTDTSFEIIVTHGYSNTNREYIASIFWKEHVPLDAEKINWVREGVSVVGYSLIDGVPKKICERINGNAKREATCFKEYKDLTKYQCSDNTKLPIPDPWEFNQKKILEEINLKKKTHVTLLFEQ